jgi:hypothetical protein
MPRDRQRGNTKRGLCAENLRLQRMQINAAKAPHVTRTDAEQMVLMKIWRYLQINCGFLDSNNVFYALMFTFLAISGS